MSEPEDTGLATWAKLIVTEMDRLTTAQITNATKMSEMTKEVALIAQRLEAMTDNYNKCQERLERERQEHRTTRIEGWKIALSAASVLIALALMGLAIMQFVNKFLK